MKLVFTGKDFITDVIDADFTVWFWLSLWVKSKLVQISDESFWNRLNYSVNSVKWSENQINTILLDFC